MKKAILVIAVLALLLGLAAALSACGETDPEVTIETEAPKATEAPKSAATPKPTEAPVQTLGPAQTDAPAPDRSVPTETPAPERDYVINTSTGKFHYPTCSSVKDIKPGNRSDVRMTRDEVIAMGYTACGKCKP